MPSGITKNEFAGVHTGTGEEHAARRLLSGAQRPFAFGFAFVDPNLELSASFVMIPEFDDRSSHRSTRLVLIERAARVFHGDPPAYEWSDPAFRGQSQQIGVDLVGHVPSERIEAEPPHSGINRLHPGQHHTHDVDVPDAGHP